MKQDTTPSIRLTYLFHLLVTRKITQAQKGELMLLMADKAHEQQVYDLIEGAWENFDFDQPHFAPEESESLMLKILGSTAFGKNRKLTDKNIRLSNWARMAIAASVTLLLLAGGYFYTSRYITPPEVSQELLKNDVAPGNNNAVLTLSDGKKIVLENAPVGTLVDEGPIRISKLQDGSLSYVLNEKYQKQGHPEGFNTIVTPKGGKHKVTLPDGSKVWLNAASSLKYPAFFTGSTRRVELVGEAYFEVNPVTEIHKNESRKTPFIVSSGNQITEVLGTHFNIKSYLDEQEAKTTLLEGSIQITAVSRGNKLKLTPGQQCNSGPAGDLKLIKNADTDVAVAWKDNLFSFKDADIYNIMRQLARWYNVDVQYVGTIPDGHLTGFISQDVPLSRVLKMLEQISDLKFGMEGRKITVLDAGVSVK